MPVALVRPLRAAVLRPGEPDDALRWPGDDEPGTLHVAARGPDGAIAAVGTIVIERLPGVDGPDAWRVRGMAALPELRGRGLGAAVLARLLAHADEHGDGVVWCHARPGAASLYERAGFRRVGEPYEHEGRGPHLLLVRPVRAKP